MLIVHYSPNWQFNAERSVQEICEAARKGEGKRILIVPEQNSFETEVALCREGGDGISAKAEVLSFTRLASRVFSAAGGAAIPTLDQSGRMIAMAGALELLRPKLKLYAKNISKPEFLQQLLQVVDEFHSCGVNARTLSRAAEELDGALAEKITELTMILEVYEAVCESSKLDPSTRLDRLKDALLESGFADRAYVVVEGFSDFTEQEMNVLCALMQRAEQLSVYLTCDALDRGQTVFSVPRQTAAKLCRKAKSLGVPALTFRAAVPNEDRITEQISSQLFSASIVPYEQKTDAISLIPCRTAAEECAAAAAQIQNLIQNGSRYRDIAVAYTDPIVYGSVLESTFARYAMPYYSSGGKELLRHSVIRGVLSALEAAACGMEPESVSEYLKSGYAGITEDDADLLENYAFVWTLRGNRWNRPFEKSPDGPSVDFQADQSVLLERLNMARVLAIEPLCEMKRALRDAKDTAQQIDALNAFLEKIHLERLIGEKIEQTERSGDLQSVQELAQLYEILLNTMEQIYGVLGTSSRSPEDFYRLFRAALTMGSVGSIPAAVDCIRIGELRQMRHTQAKHLLVLGANDGAFPAFDRSAGLLSDSERLLLKQTGLQVAPDESERMNRTLLIVYELLTAPTGSLFMSCDRESPSYLFLRLQRIFENCVQSASRPQPVKPVQLAAKLAELEETSCSAFLREHPEFIKETKRIRAGANYRPGTLDRDTVKLLYGRSLSLSSSKIDRLAACKYAYFLQFGLKLKELRQADLDPTVYGILVHEVLEKTVKIVQEEGGFHKVSLERTLELSRYYFERFLQEKLDDLESYSRRGAYLVRRNYREIEQVVRILYQELSHSDFIPVSFEKVFADDTAIPITGDLCAGRLSGVVDRVDLFTDRLGKTYLRVIDYKTGRKDFDYTDILNGIGMQMLIYLFALTREAERFYGTKLEPAGVLYVSARYEVQATKGRLPAEEAEKERRKKLRRKGLVLDDEAVLQAMEAGDDTLFLPYKLNRKTGARSGDLASSDQLLQVERHVERTLKRLTDRLGSGEISPDPYWRGEENNACQWCPYRQICHVDSGEVPLRKMRAVTQDRFWDSLEKEEQEHGR